MFSVILKKIITFIHIYLRCCKIPSGYSSNSSNVSDYSENYWIEKTSKAVTLIWRRNNIEKSKWITHWYLVRFQSRINVEFSTANGCHNFHVDSLYKIKEILTNFRRRLNGESTNKFLSGRFNTFTSLQWIFNKFVSLNWTFILKNLIDASVLEEEILICDILTYCQKNWR